MKKRCISLLLAALCCVGWLTMAAAEGKTYVRDTDEVFAAEEISALNARAAEIDGQYGCFVGIAIVQDPGDSLSGYLQTAIEDMNGEEDGILLGFSQQAKVWSMVRQGKAQEVFSERDEDALWALFAADSWYDGAMAYLDGAAK
ncbi:MAG: TPM domain-containing protein, partial [Acutalibacteraceae bacterium]